VAVIGVEAEVVASAALVVEVLAAEAQADLGKLKYYKILNIRKEPLTGGSFLIKLNY
jgi:hypothetical protein